MSLFEFLMVLVSIIVGLGIAEILSGVARMIRCRESIRGYWVHGLAVALVFLALLQQWWEIWGLRNTPEWTFASLLMMLAGPVGLFLIAHLMFPVSMSGANVREYYYGVMRPAWSIAAATVLLATLFRPLVFHWQLFTPDNATSLAFFVGFLLLAISKRPQLHAVLMPFFLALLLIDILQWSFAISAD